MEFVEANIDFKLIGQRIKDARIKKDIHNKNLLNK